MLAEVRRASPDREASSARRSSYSASSRLPRLNRPAVLSNVACQPESVALNSGGGVWARMAAGDPVRTSTNIIVCRNRYRRLGHTKENIRIGPGKPDGETPDQPDAQAYHTKWLVMAILWR